MMVSLVAGPAVEPADQSLTGRVETLPGGRVDVVVVGEVDASSQQQLGSLLCAAWAEHPVRLVVDLRGVTFFGLSALRVLAVARARARSGGTAFEVLSAGSGVARVLRFLDDLP